jgi:GNAT superfamily N-acetyltransferase
MSSEGSSELVLRRSTAADRTAIIELCRASLGWEADDPNEAFFAWKHDENAFGPSPSWVAVADDGTLAGLRVFLRWRFREPSGTTFTGVRAVDTATHPDWQGKGIFTKLTLGAIPDLRDDGVDVIFNTPNDKSRPGYLKMGWSEVGRVPVGVRPTSLRSLRTIARARTAADLWSTASDVGIDASEAFADTDAVERLLSRCPGAGGIETDRTPAYLRWRYSFGPLRYRAVLVGDRLEDGVVVVRLRRRGPALECAVCDVLVPAGVSRRSVVAHIARASGADYLLRCVGTLGVLDGFLPAPQLGPILTWRPICRTGVPRTGDLSLTLGDVELF